MNVLELLDAKLYHLAEIICLYLDKATWRTLQATRIQTKLSKPKFKLIINLILCIYSNYFF